MVTSQGTVTELGDNFVDVMIDPTRFPSIESIFNPLDKTGRFLRKYRMVNNECQILDERDNIQVPWKSFSKMKTENITRLFLHEDTKHNFSVGDLLGIKSKCCGNRRNVVDFCGGDDIVLKDLVLSRQSRMVLRCGISNIVVSNVSILREHPAQCLSTPGGGPQLGQPYDEDIHNVTVDGVRAENTGDDSVALLNVKTGAIVKNCNIW